MSSILRDLKSSSIKVYRKQISTILKNVYGKDYMSEQDILKYFKNPEPILKWISSKALNTKISYLSAIVVYMSPVERNKALHGYENIMKFYQNEKQN